MQASYLSRSSPLARAKSRNIERGFFPVWAHWWLLNSWSCICQNLPCSPAHSAPAERRCAATGTTVPHRRSRLPPRATDRTLSFVSTPPPRFVVLVVLKSGGGIARPPFRLVHDAPTLRDLRRIVRHAHLIV